MVVADDERRYVAVNTAACLLLRLPEEEVLGLRIEDLTPPENRPLVEDLWDAFIRAGVQEGRFELLMPDGGQLEVDYSATANVEAGRHLSVLMFPPAAQHHGQAEQTAGGVLTEREREILTLVAMGRGTAGIAADLGVAASTVETHVRHFMDKLGARNRAHAIAIGIHAGEISLDLALPIVDIGDRRRWNA